MDTDRQAGEGVPRIDCDLDVPRTSPDGYVGPRDPRVLLSVADDAARVLQHWAGQMRQCLLPSVSRACSRSLLASRHKIPESSSTSRASLCSGNVEVILWTVYFFRRRCNAISHLILS